MLGSKIKFCADLLTLHITKITVKYYHPVFLKFPVVSLFPAGTVPLILTVLSDSVHSALYLPVAAEAASPVADMPATAVSRTVVPAVALPVSSLNIYTGRIHQG